MKTHNGLNRLKEGVVKGAAAVVLGPLAVTGCSSAADANRQPTVAASPASTEPSPEATPIETPTPEQTFDPSSDTTKIEIGGDIIENYYEQLSKIDAAMPGIVTLANVDGGDNPATLKIGANGNSYNITGSNSDSGVDFDATMTRTNREVVVKRPGYSDTSYYVSNQVLDLELSDGTKVSVIFDYNNGASWKDTLGQATEKTVGNVTYDPYGLRYFEKQVSDYNPGGTNRVGEAVDPDQPVTMQTSGFFFTSPVISSNPKAIATILMTDQNGNTIGVQVSNRRVNSSDTDTRISNISPAEIIKIAKQYNLTVSFKDPDSLPKDDVALYDIVKSSLESLPAPK